jgi:PAS domain S-box-containing protein
MKLRTRVKLAIAITVCVFLVYGAALFYMDRTMAHLAQEVQNANELSSRISLLRTLSLDNLIYQTERSRRQWEAVYDEVRHLLVDKVFLELQHEYGLGDLGDKVRIVGDTFQKLLTLPGGERADGPEPEVSPQLRNRLTTQLMLTTHDLLNRFVILREEVNERLIRTQRLISIVNLLALLSLGLIIFRAGFFLQRSVLQPVLKLHEGAEIIGAGDLDYKVGINTRDEIGQLSQAFDRMTVNLQKVTVSRDELLKEMAERRRAEEALRESEEKVRRQLEEIELIYQSAPVGLCYFDRDLRYVRINERLAEINGLPAAEHLGRTTREVLPEMAPQLEELLNRALETGEPLLNVEINGATPAKPGVPRHWIVQYVPQKDAAGQIIGINIVVEEITERKRAEEALRESEAKYRNLFENMTEEVHLWQLVWDDSGNIKTWRLVDANPPTLKTWGRRGLEEIVGKTSDEIFGPGATDHYLPVVQKIMTEGVPYYFEDYFPNLDKYFRFTSVPFGEYFITTGADITSIKKAEQKLRESREDLNRAQAVAHVGSWRLDVRKNELTWSDETYRMFGIPRGTPLTYEIFLGTIYLEDREYVEREWTSALKGKPYDIEHRIVADGMVKWVREQAELEFDQEGRLLGGFGTVQDITERKRIEEALEARSAELFRAVSELEETNVEMERFTYMISHDLKSPLVTISTFLRYLEEDLRQGDADRVDKDLHFIGTAAEKMGQLLSELLEMSRIGRVVNAPVEVTFKELVHEALQSVAGPISQRGVKVQMSSEDITLFGDRPRLVEVWQNLVENAVKYLGEQAEPRLSLGFQQQGEDTVFTVCDNGMGIDPKYQGKIFGLFEKLDSKTGGTGIGLAIVKRIVELYQGNIWVESAGLGQGACFRFTLPEAVKGLGVGET